MKAWILAVVISCPAFAGCDPVDFTAPVSEMQWVETWLATPGIPTGPIWKQLIERLSPYSETAIDKSTLRIERHAATIAGETTGTKPRLQPRSYAFGIQSGFEF
jgi:hypothetical protein